MNIMLLKDLKSKYDKVEVIRHDHKTSYVLCTNYHELDFDKLDRLVKVTRFGTITIENERIVESVRYREEDI